MATFHGALLFCIFLPIFLISIISIINHVQATGLDDRIDCRIINDHIYENECLKRGCIWNQVNKERVPWCYVDNEIGYKIEKSSYSSDSITASLKLKNSETQEINCPRISSLNVKISYITDKIVRIKVNSADSKRYEVPIQDQFNIPSYSVEKNKQLYYNAEIRNDDASIIVTRNDNGVKLIDTSIAGLIFCDKFLQFATYLPNNTDYYGFGENYREVFKHDLSYRTLPLFTRDRAVGNKNGNNYGQHPFMMGVQEDGKSFGIFLLNSNAMAYTFLPAPALSLKMTGGIMDIFVFVGSNPEEVVSLYTSVIGRPIMPPFWSLGYQNCRWGYKNTEELNKTIQRNLRYSVPLDVQYMDIDYMEKRRDFTYSSENFKQLPELIEETKKIYSLRWTLILDPAIEAISNYHPFTEGYSKDVFIKWPENIAKKIKFPPNVPTDKNILYGKVWPDGPVAFPDFFKNSTKIWWKQRIREFHENLKFDALWIDMNEPSNFDGSITEYKCPEDEFFFKEDPMKFNEPLNKKTICLDALQGENGEYRHYDVHSLYGWSESKPTLDGLREATKKRGFVVSRSTYPSSGKYVAHWLGDNKSIWEHLRQSIIGMMEFSLFGISFTGADICGFNGAPTSELCRRWFQLGAYYPFSRSHNSINQPEQDPAWWVENGHPEVTKAAVEALRVRYQLLHYYYTAFYNANQNGETVVRPMHHVFIKDKISRNIDKQFFIGSSIMIAPFLFPNETFKQAYVPSFETDWYIIDDDFVKKAIPVSSHIYIDDAHSNHPLIFKGGCVIPIVSQNDLPRVLNTVSLRKAPITLWILPGIEKNATGNLFYDDGESIDTIGNGDYALFEFIFHKCILNIKVKHQGLIGKNVESLFLKEILIAAGKDALNGIQTNNIQVRFNGSDEDISAVIDDKHNIRIKIHSLFNMLKEHGQEIVITKKGSNNCFIH